MSRLLVCRRLPLLAALAGLLFVLLATPSGAQEDPRYFTASGFRVDNDAIWEFIRSRGGPRAFGLPISRTFTLLGYPTQVFQRHVLQSIDDMVVNVGLLDNGWMPYRQIGYAVLPPLDPSLTVNAPTPGSRGYVERMYAYLAGALPDQVDGQPTNFFKLFSETVPVARPPANPVEREIQVLANLDVWGIATSRPVRDPFNPNLISVRLERGVFRYDAACRCTEPLPLGAIFRSILTGVELPADLEIQAPDSPYLRQYDMASHQGPFRPQQLPDTSFTYAFLPSREQPPLGGAPLLPAGPSFAPTSTPVPPGFVPGASAASPTASPTPTATALAAGAPAASPSSTPTATPGVAAIPIGRPPESIVLGPEEAGPETVRVRQLGGDDSRAFWTEVAYDRNRHPETNQLGPNVIVNRVYVARTVDLARALYGEQAAVRSFPEAVDRFGPIFFLPPPQLGQDSQAMASCLEAGCSATSYFIHHRLVFRAENAVAVFYAYGDQSSSQLRDVVFLARRVADRMVP